MPTCHLPRERSEHCASAWAGALASFAHTEPRCSIGTVVALDNCWFDGREYHPYKQKEPEPIIAQHQLMWSDDPRSLHRLG